MTRVLSSKRAFKAALDELQRQLQLYEKEGPDRERARWLILAEALRTGMPCEPSDAPTSPRPGSDPGECVRIPIRYADALVEFARSHDDRLISVNASVWTADVLLDDGYTKILRAPDGRQVWVLKRPVIPFATLYPSQLRVEAPSAPAARDASSASGTVAQ